MSCECGGLLEVNSWGELVCSSCGEVKELAELKPSVVIKKKDGTIVVNHSSARLTKTKDGSLSLPGTRPKTPRDNLLSYEEKKLQEAEREIERLCGLIRAPRPIVEQTKTCYFALFSKNLLPKKSNTYFLLGVIYNVLRMNECVIPEFADAFGAKEKELKKQLNKAQREAFELMRKAGISIEPGSLEKTVPLNIKAFASALRFPILENVVVAKANELFRLTKVTGKPSLIAAALVCAVLETLGFEPFKLFEEQVEKVSGEKKIFGVSEQAVKAKKKEIYCEAGFAPISATPSFNGFHRCLRCDGLFQGSACDCGMVYLS